MEKRNCIDIVMPYTMLIVKAGFAILLKAKLIILLLCFLPQFDIKAQDSYSPETDISSFSYDEIPVLVMVEGYKHFYINAIYANNDLLYLNVTGLFQTLEIPCIVGQKGDIISGFIENESRIYIIDYNQRQIKVGSKMISTNNGIVKEMGALYMELPLFAEAFGINMTFNYRALTIILKPDFELPVIKQQRLEKMRSNMTKITGKEITDTVVQRNYHLFRFGMVDWSVASNQIAKGSTDNRFSLGIGTELLYGEADVSVNYYDRQKFDSRQLYYLWRWVDNDKKIIKQAQLGRISNQTISFINAPVIGAVVRNSPTTVRKATGYYTISEYTEPNWTIELYINNVMIDYTKADASGLYVFKVPNVYGYSTLKLKFYGPLGEERTEERTMNVPYTVMPAREFEYSIAAGMLQDSILSRFGRGEFNYGVNRMITVGGGLEYLSSIPNDPFIPFVKTTIQPFSKLTFTGEYAHGVKARGLLDYYFWKDALFEIDYTKYKEGQLATRFNALEERKAKLSIPFRYKKISVFTKLEYTQLVYKKINYNLANVIVSAYYKQYSASSSTQINWIDNKPSYATSDLSLSYRLGKGFTLRPSARYNVSESNFISYKAAIEKSIPKGYFTISYERNVLYNNNSINLNFKYDLSFARINISAFHSNGKMYTSESAQGSLAFGSGNKHVHASNNPSVGKGGISLYPFLDLNHNGIFDDGERMVKITSVKVMGSKAIFNKNDSIIRIPDLYAFTNCIVEVNDNDLENIAWRFKSKRYQILIDPNQFKRIDIPVISVGEASGMAYMNNDGELKGLGRIQIKFYDRNNMALVAETLSESDGYISYLGLEPGEYIAQVDSAQLKNLDFKVYPKQIDFTVKSLEEGDIVKGLDFILNNNEIIQSPVIDSLPQINTAMDIIAENDVKIGKEELLRPAPHNQTIKDSIGNLIHEVSIDRNDENIMVWGNICTQIGNYCVQCGAFKYKSNALRFALYIEKNTGMATGIILQNSLYKVRVGCVSSKREAFDIKNRLTEKIFNDDMFVLIRK
jgi:hypothetical protein